MEQGTHSAVPIALGSASSDTEEGRAFFQDRLGLYAKWVFIFSGSFYALNLNTVHLTLLVISYASAEAACMAQESRRWRAHWRSCPKGPESLTT